MHPEPDFEWSSSNSPLFPAQQNIVVEDLIRSLRGLLINYLLMTLGISEWLFSQDDKMFAECRGFGRQISQVWNHWTRCVCVEDGENVLVIAEHRFNEKSLWLP